MIGQKLRGNLNRGSFRKGVHVPIGVLAGRGLGVGFRWVAWGGFSCGK